MVVHALQILTVHPIIAKMGSAAEAGIAVVLLQTVLTPIKLILCAMLLAHAKDIEMIRLASVISAALLLILTMTSVALMDYYLIVVACMFLFFAMDSRHKAILHVLAHAHLIRNVIPMHIVMELVLQIFQMD